MVTYNNKKMHNDKRKSELSTPEKVERKESKMRKNKYLKPLQLADDKEVITKMRQMFGPAELTLSQTPLKSTPNKLMTTLKMLGVMMIRHRMRKNRTVPSYYCSVYTLH
jgi:hypothetical protein